VTRAAARAAFTVSPVDVTPFLDDLRFAWSDDETFEREDGTRLRGRGVLLRGLDLVRWDDARFSGDGALVFGVAGVSHRRDALAGGFELGSRVTLVPEPENAFDPDAIAVYDAAGGLQAGYVPRDLTALVRQLAPGSAAVVHYEWRLEGDERCALRCVIGPPRFVQRIERFVREAPGGRLA
jgi:hypothetical protein